MINNFDWFGKWTAYTPDKIALKDAESDLQLTYGQINRAANSIAFYLQDKYQIKKGDRIAVISENGLTQVLLFAAAQKMGFILVPINRLLSSG